jgi:hypothetical protein
VPVAGLLARPSELAADGPLDDAEQIPGGIADAIAARAAHSSSTACRSGASTCCNATWRRLLFRLQFREALGPLQVAQRAPAR